MAEILEITNEQYQAIEAMSFSSFKEFYKSPAHYKAYKEKPREGSTPSQIIGTLVHAAILEPHTLESKFAVIDGHRGSTKVKEAVGYAESLGKTTIKSEQLIAAQRCREAIQAHPIIKDLLVGGRAEVSIVVKDKMSGAPIKCRADYFWPEAGVVLDLKTFDDLTDRSVERQIVRMGYDLQAVHYLNVASQYLNKDLRLFGNIFIETEAPYGVRLVTLSDASLEKALEKWKYFEMLDRYKLCLEENTWPNYDTAPYTAQLF